MLEYCEFHVSLDSVLLKEKTRTLLLCLKVCTCTGKISFRFYRVHPIHHMPEEHSYHFLGANEGKHTKLTTLQALFYSNTNAELEILQVFSLAKLISLKSPFVLLFQPHDLLSSSNFPSQSFLKLAVSSFWILFPASLCLTGSFTPFRCQLKSHLLREALLDDLS